MADQIIIGASHLKAEAQAGMNGDPSASSRLPGDKPIVRGTVAKKLMAGSAVNVPTDNGQTRRVSADQKVKTTFGQRNRSGTGGKIPLAIDHGKK